MITAITFLCYSHSTAFGQTDTIENSANNSTSTNWSMYTSDNVGVSFNYPSEWDVIEKENRFDVTAADVLVSGDNADFAVKIIDRTEDRPLKSYALLSSTKMLEDALSQNSDTAVIEHSSTEKYKVGGEKAGSFLLGFDKGGIPSGMQNLIVFHEGDGYMLSFIAPSQTFDSSETQGLLNKIIESFNFLN